MKAFRIIAKAAVAFYDELFHVALMGFATLIGCLLFFFAPYLFSITFVNVQQIAGQLGALLEVIVLVAVFSIPGAFTVAGLYAACQKTVRGEGMKWRHYWGGIKEFGLRTWLIFMGMMVGYGIAAVNIIFYNNPDWSPFPAQVAIWLTPLWAVLALVWTVVHFYVQPYLMELVEPKFSFIYRNSLFQVMLHPIATLLFIIVSILVMVLSVVIPVLLIFSPAFVIILALTAVRELTASAEERATKFAEEDAEKEAQAETEAIEAESEE